MGPASETMQLCQITDPELFEGFLGATQLSSQRLDTVKEKLAKAKDYEWRGSHGTSCAYPLLFLYTNARIDEPFLMELWKSGNADKQEQVMKVLSNLNLGSAKGHAIALKLADEVRNSPDFRKRTKVIRATADYLAWSCGYGTVDSFVRDCLENHPGHFYPELPRLAYGLIAAHRENTGSGDFIAIRRPIKLGENIKAVLQHAPKDLQELFGPDGM